MTDCGRHVAPEQQPLGQLSGSHPEHTPALHVSPVGQREHASPAAPHAAGSLPVAHTLPSQHPALHELASHTHAPATQR